MGWVQMTWKGTVTEKENGVGKKQREKMKIDKTVGQWRDGGGQNREVALTNSSNMGSTSVDANSSDVVMVNFICQLTLAKGCPHS